MTGYDLADEIFDNIGKDKNHNISLKDVVRVISFWGFNEEADKSTKIGFVCYCARDSLKKIIEKALVYGDYRMLDAFYKETKCGKGDEE